MGDRTAFHHLTVRVALVAGVGLINNDGSDYIASETLDGDDYHTVDAEYVVA